MKSSRRSFIKNSILGAGLMTFPFDLFRFTGAYPDFAGQIGVCTDISNNGILADAGYSFIEETVGNFLVPSEDEAVFRTKLHTLKESKLPVEVCNVFIPGRMKSVGPAPAHKEILDFATSTFQRARIAGVKIIVFGSSGSRSVPQGWTKNEAREQFISLGKKIASIAEVHDVVIALEPLNSKECNFINSVAEGGEIVNEINHKNFRLMADIYHMLMENESPDAIFKCGDLLHHVHIAEKTGRSAPGVHNEDFTPYLKALKDIGYKGRISIECNWKNLAEEAGRALQTIKRQSLNS
jgi:sugar phosphate isomerase/epimerase